MKTLAIYCSPAMKDLICQSMLEYADYAYPAGVDECSLAAREALIDCEKAMQKQFDAEKNQTVISRRIRALVKLAIQYHFRVLNQETGQNNAHEIAVLLDVASGENIPESTYLASKSKDQGQ